MTCALACSPRPRVSERPRLLLLLLAWLALPSAFAATSVEQLLATEQPPSGVVFEIVEGDEDALSTLIPKTRKAIERLRARFPDIEVAVVSHGREQFALQTRYQKDYRQIHQGIQSLVQDDVPVHVCGAHAGWYGVTPEDFPEYVDVPASGPSQIRQYQALGFELVLIQNDDE